MEEEDDSKIFKDSIGQNQFYDLITGEDVSWQGIIYDLVRTEQLDPWDIDITILADKYLAVIEEIEEANFFVSSKVLLACSLLLRLKAEILVNSYISDLNEVLFGKGVEEKRELDRIEIDEDELPLLVPRTPMPRFKRVTLNELMASLNKAIETENRRIRREIKQKRAEKSALVVLPKKNRIPLRSRISMIFKKVTEHLKPKERIRMKYSALAPSRGEKLDCFVPVLHLANSDKLYLYQDKHFDEIHLALDKLHSDLDFEEEGLEQ